VSGLRPDTATANAADVDAVSGRRPDTAETLRA
jgi:hypothetical protein